MCNENKSAELNYRYILTEEIYINDGESIEVYGIAAVTSDKKTGSAVIENYPALSSDRTKVQALVDMCNAGALDIIHLRDVAEDFVLHI